MTARSWGRRSAVVALAAVLVACSPPGQDKVVARVNGEAIGAREVEIALKTGATAGLDSRARERLVEKLVIEELLAQQFLRSAPGSAAVERSAVSAARREILARSYVEDLVAEVQRPSADEIAAFYRDRPDLYSARRVFTVRELDVAVGPPRDAEVRRRVVSARTLGELEDWLRRENLGFTTSELERASDELDAEAAAQLDRLAEGDVGVIDTASGLRVVQLVGKRAAPLDERSAWPHIEARLWREKRVAAIEAEVRRLTGLAAISIPAGPSRGAMQALVPDGEPAPVQMIPTVPPTSVKAPGG